MMCFLSGFRCNQHGWGPDHANEDAGGKPTSVLDNNSGIFALQQASMVGSIPGEGRVTWWPGWLADGGEVRSLVDTASSLASHGPPVQGSLIDK